MLAQNKTAETEQIRIAFAAASEWLLSDSLAKTFAVQTDEIEIETRRDWIVLGCLTARGWQTWRVVGWRQENGKLIFDVDRTASRAAQRIEFVPRVSVHELREDTNAARLAAARELAEQVRKTFSKSAKIVKVNLNQSNTPGKVGTVARILLELPNGKTAAACGSIAEFGKTKIENLLAHSILWFTALPEKRKHGELWIVVEPKAVEEMRKLCALLREVWRARLKILSRDLNAADGDERLNIHNPLTLNDLWLEKPRKFARAKSIEINETADKFSSVAPGEIDAATFKHRAIVRYNGLPFVKIRQVMGAENVWFGVDARSKRILNESSLPEFEKLFDDLRRHRRHDAPDKRNVLYKLHSESWLESILRRDVSRLDPNLILAPLHAQFRFSGGALDLLAQRIDGRLVVIELKTSTDREHALQAANYWRQVEAHRRAGNFERARIFGDAPILDEPALVYLVAPLMSFHHDFDVLAGAITPEIELWRFDLNEDWRAGVRVARRSKIV